MPVGNVVWNVVEVKVGKVVGMVLNVTLCVVLDVGVELVGVGVPVLNVNGGAVPIDCVVSGVNVNGDVVVPVGKVYPFGSVINGNGVVVFNCNAQ